MTTLHNASVRHFASDNYAGAHPEVLAALAAANGGHQPAYGDDLYTEHLGEVFARHFGEGVRAFPVFNGTGANVVSLQAMLPRWGAVIAAGTSHINNDECGAPERIGGLKLLTVPTPDGKLTPELIATEAWGFGDVHRAEPHVVSITQSTELGTLYTPAEITAITEYAHAQNMRVHVDGSRLANAAAALDLPLRAFTTDAGVDTVSFGGTKNGLVFGEAVLVLNPDSASGVDYLRKMDMQLGSKMRFVSAQLIALLEGDLWLRSAAHANAMAARLRGTLDRAIAEGRAPGLSFAQPTQVNALFASLPAAAADRVRADFRFYDWDAATEQVRWMTAFDTTEGDVDAFAAAIISALAG
ncbi:threonine aldolase family protein [Mycetocola spongiae]|uniref:threonine aldolase family protein n=1 Tax=Mycetocola spongiae TaxID=2859226 RepID=UPI001CF4F0EE|nr:beta-eliminating lyase-related protein [Mycetocola spongiae]UCR88353.1 threonine aldolase [Mycetocola spongiae]